MWFACFPVKLASNAENVSINREQIFFEKNGVDRLSKKFCFWDRRDVNFRLAYLTSNDPSGPFQQTWGTREDRVGAHCLLHEIADSLQ